MEAPEITWHQLVRRMAAWLGTMSWHLAAGVAETTRDRLTGRTRDGTMARHVGRMVTALGPTFIKGGQLMSTRRDVLPRAWCDRLGLLHDQVAPMPSGVARRALAAAYPGEWPFASFDWTPCASGSIACVYRASLPDGRTVAVKVRRPGIEQRMRSDFVLLGLGAAVLQRIPFLRKVPMRRMVDEIGAAVQWQLDLRRESVALRSLRDNLAHQQFVHVPCPLPELSRDEALVMEFVDGLTRFTPGDFGNEERRRITRRLLAAVYQMLFVDGLVHCDMHPGNLYLTRTGTVVLLDAGFVVPLPERMRRLFAEFFLNMAMGRAADCADVVLRSAEEVPPDSDVEGFRRGVVELVTEVHGQTAGRFRLAPFATRLFDLQRRSGISAAPEFVFPLMSLLVLEGMINDFDTDVDFQAEAIPTLLSVLRT